MGAGEGGGRGCLAWVGGGGGVRVCGGSHDGWRGFDLEAFCGLYVAEERFDSSGVG